MVSKSFKYTALALNILERVLGSKFSIEGIDNLPKQPVLFVSNHFTRFETFVVPYIIYKHTGRQVRCLADSGLFHGVLGKFLTSVGTISTKNPNRDNIILKDLMQGSYDWMIYPEGSMIKSKETKREGRFVNYTPSRVGPVRTGSAIMALKSQLFRDEMKQAAIQNKSEYLQQLEQETNVEYSEKLRILDTYVIPLTISYYPIRPGENKIKKLAARLIKKIPSSISEELEIEGNLLLNADINLFFGQPINLANYIKSVKSLIKQVPLIRSEAKTSFILKYFKYRLTNDFMDKIYLDLQINLDHIFSAVLRHLQESEVSIDRLKRIIYLSATMIDKRKYRLNQSILEENLVKIFIDEPHKEFESAFNLAENQSLISKISDQKILINKEKLNQKYDFHEIRIENTLQVIGNEFSLLRDLDKIVQKNCKTADEILRKRVFQEIYDRDLEIFENDYVQFFDSNFSKDKSVGAPFFLDTNSSKTDISVLVCHGYKSSPREVSDLARYINSLGFKTYSVRLKGHGTSPKNIKEVTWQDWYDSLQRGYAALKNNSSKIVVIGFSTGGLLALLSGAKKDKSADNIAGIVSINSALKLLDIRAKFVPGINIWNDLLTKFHINKNHFEFIDDMPENPEINYSRNYLKGVEQLGKLMEEISDNLAKILVPTLVIQAKHDPVVNPISGKIIFEKIVSKNKLLVEPDFSNHCIVTGKNKTQIFEMIKTFLVNLNLL